MWSRIHLLFLILQSTVHHAVVNNAKPLQLITATNQVFVRHTVGDIMIGCYSSNIFNYHDSVTIVMYILPWYYHELIWRIECQMLYRAV